MPPVTFEPTIPASKQPQTCALDHMATVIGYIKMYSTVIWLAVLCVLKIRFVSTREELTLTVFENRVLREILVHNTGEVVESSDVYILLSFVCSELDGACSICVRCEKLRRLAWET